MSKPLTSILPKFLVVFSLVADAISGCGGEVDSNQSPAGPAPSPGANTSAGGSQNGDSPGATLLADCNPGFSVQQATAAKPCNFFVGTSCYSTFDEACGCACPRDKGPVVCVADGNAYLAGTSAYGVWCEPTSG